MRVRVKSVISFHCRNMCAFSAVAWCFYVADTVAHLSAGTEGGMCSFTGRYHPLNATDGDYQQLLTHLISNWLHTYEKVRPHLWQCLCFVMETLAAGQCSADWLFVSHGYKRHLIGQFFYTTPWGNSTFKDIIHNIGALNCLKKTTRLLSVG